MRNRAGILRRLLMACTDYGKDRIFPLKKSALQNGGKNGSDRCGRNDTFVAATALHFQLPLLTMNIKHYKHIPNLQLIRHTLKPLQGGRLQPFIRRITATSSTGFAPAEALHRSGEQLISYDPHRKDRKWSGNTQLSDQRLPVV